MKQKLYPFSVQKHAHDIDFRRNRAFNEFVESEYKDARLARLLEQLDEIRCLMAGGVKVVWLTGQQYALAQESVGWAIAERK